MSMRLQMRRPAPRPESQDRLVPLINVVFLMLIFFMLVGTLRPSDPFVVQPPASDTGNVRTSSTVEILIGAQGDLRIGGKALAAIGADTNVQGTEQITAALSAAWPTRTEGATMRLRRLEIRADKQIAMTLLNQVLKAAGLAGADEIKLITQRR